MRTRAKDRIKLSDGNVMTLGEALDDGRVILKQDSGKRYLAEEVGRGVYWDIGQKLFESRSKKAVPPKQPDRYYVWALHGDEPAGGADGPYFRFEEARDSARDAAFESDQDHAVSLGNAPLDSKFAILARYEAGTGIPR